MTDCTIAEAELRGIITSIFKIAAPVIGDLLSREKLRGVAAGPGPSDAELRGLTDTIKSIFKTAAPVIVDLLSREKLRGVAHDGYPYDGSLPIGAIDPLLLKLTKKTRDLTSREKLRGLAVKPVTSDAELCGISGAKGLSLHIGLNRIDQGCYPTWPNAGALRGCEFDANAMETIAVRRGFAARSLLTAAATLNNVMAKIQSAASQLNAGDIFLLSYAGHGSFRTDYDNDEEDRRDETWCLYDGELVDDDLDSLLAEFKAGVRVLIISDSCHSGTMLRGGTMYQPRARSGRMTRNGIMLEPDAFVAGDPTPEYRGMPMEVREHQKMNEANRPLLRKAQPQVQASVIFLSACQDNQAALDLPSNGMFTSKLLQVWANASYTGSYPYFMDQIKMLMPPQQTPNYSTGGSHPDVLRRFESQVPFSIGLGGTA